MRDGDKNKRERERERERNESRRVTSESAVGGSSARAPCSLCSVCYSASASASVLPGCRALFFSRAAKARQAAVKEQEFEFEWRETRGSVSGHIASYRGPSTIRRVARSITHRMLLYVLILLL